MGYYTGFSSKFSLDKPLDDDTYDLLLGLSETRRMARSVAEKYGVEGEFYTEERDNMGQDDNKNIIDYNRPPKTQPGLWCQWVPTEDRKYITWNGGENFNSYIEWIEYLIDKILKPRGYILSGKVSWQGDEPEDRGIISITNNRVETLIGSTIYLGTDDFNDKKLRIMQRLESLKRDKEGEIILNFLENLLDNDLKEIIIDSMTDS